MSEPGTVLSAAEARDEAALQRFIQTQISPNAWPIHSPALRVSIRENGVDLEAARRFTMDVDAMERLIRGFHLRMCRIERALGIENAYHRALHNHEVALRLLLLEWPDGLPIPAEIRGVERRVYATIDDIVPAMRAVLASLVEAGVRPNVLARDLLAALGHDYGHTGGNDRRHPGGTSTPLTHEETAEKHVAPMGLALRMPPALVLESLGGIRATTFHTRPGRQFIRAANEFEWKLTTADVMGCVLPPDLWLTHVGIPVLLEKLPAWRVRLPEIRREMQRIQDLLVADPGVGDAERSRMKSQREALAREEKGITKDVGQWFRGERAFFLFIESEHLSLVPRARDLWRGILRRKVALLSRVLERSDLLEPLVQQGFPMVDAFARAITGARNLEAVVNDASLDPRLRELLSMFLPRKRGSRGDVRGRA